VILEFNDTGVGIPDGFEPFHLFKTSKVEGTGLGLPIVQQIISDHRGTVEYVSEVGKGSTFRVTLGLVDRSV
jgi:signal transduction histidine kinase